MRVVEAIAKRILNLCEERNISINKLALMSGLTQSTVQSIIGGKSKNPKILTVVVDLFLRNGFSFNRFVELNFDNGNYKLFIINPNEIPEVSKENIRKYLKNNINLLENSVLSKKAINFILNF